jgi:nicotinamidase-related amidase
MTQCFGSKLAAERAALVVIDVQEKLAAAMKRREQVAAVSAALVRAAGVLRVPVLVTRQYPKGLGGLVPEVESALGDARRAGTEVVVVDKTAFCCTQEPAFVSALRELGPHRDQVVVCGMEAHICVAQTALSLTTQMRTVQVAADGCCSRRDFDRDVALDRMRAEGVVVTTWEAAVYEMLDEAGTEAFRDVLATVKGVSE